MCFVMLSDVWIFWTNFDLQKGPKPDKGKHRPSISWWFDLPSLNLFAHCSLGFLSYLSPGLPRVIPATSPSAEQRSWEGRFPPREEDNSSSTLLRRNVFEEFQISLSSQSIYLCHLYYLSWFNPRSKICTKQTENYWAHKKQWEGITFIVQPEQIRGWSRGMLWELNQPQSANYPRNNFRCSQCKCLVLLVFGFCTGNLLTLGK